MIPGKKVKGMGCDGFGVQYQDQSSGHHGALHQGQGAHGRGEAHGAPTGKRCVDRIIMEKAVFDVHRRKGLVPVELREAWPWRTPKEHGERLCRLTRQTHTAGDS